MFPVSGKLIVDHLQNYFFVDAWYLLDFVLLW